MYELFPLSLKLFKRTLMFKYRYLVCLIYLVGYSSLLCAQTNTSSDTIKNNGLIYELEVGYQVGGSGSVYFFTYNSGFNFNIAVGKQLREDVSLTGSIGVENNREGILYPLAVNLKKNFGKKHNSYFLGQAGYAWGSGDNESSAFSYHGGPLAGIAYGMNLLKIKQAKIYAQLGYKLRSTDIRFQAFDDTELISNKLDNHFLALQFGVQF